MNRTLLLGAAVTRRTLVKNLSMAAVASVLLRPRQSQAAEPPHLDVKDPAAQKLGYVENASQVDLKKYPAYVKGSNCENCLLLQGTTGAHYRPCSLFPGKLVSVDGWCSGWSAEI
jgi:High potential iron-sulfur protein